jgi:hypothetical protein
MDQTTRRLVRARAQGRCEYCRASQADEPFAPYQIEHVIPRQHGGSDDAANLALACPYCNLHKGPNLAGLDPLDDRLTPLFNPRTQRWEDHFARRGPLIMGQTAVGRATVRVLNMNDRPRVELRAALDAGTPAAAEDEA